MRVDMALYIVNKEPARRWFFDNGLTFEHASRMAIFTGAPIIVCLIWIYEFTGYSEELIEKMRGIVKFYDYSEISNLPPDFNYDIGLCDNSRPNSFCGKPSVAKSYDRCSPNNQNNCAELRTELDCPILRF